MMRDHPGHCCGTDCFGDPASPCECECRWCRSYSHHLMVQLIENVRLDFERMAQRAEIEDRARTLRLQGRPKLRLIRGGK